MRPPQGNTAHPSWGFCMGDISKNSAKAVHWCYADMYRGKPDLMERSEISDKYPSEGNGFMFSFLFVNVLFVCLFYFKEEEGGRKRGGDT